MARNELASLTPWITAAALQHPNHLATYLTGKLNCSRRRANKLLQRLADSQWLACSGTPRKPCHRPGALRQVVHSYALAGLQEDLPWRRDFAPFFSLPAEVQRMAQHAFTELLNNAVDHSGGERVTVSMRQTPLHVQLLVSDDGCGLFHRIAQCFDIDEPTLAMFELSKGKLTSQPERHAGHGLFYSSRLADVFDVNANSSAFQRSAWGDSAWRAKRPAPHSGTSIYLSIAIDTPRTLDSVLRSHSTDQADYRFTRTELPLKLLQAEQMLMSRADARRVTSRLQRFGLAELDFGGITAVGHGFADELFRVFPSQYPNVCLMPKKMAPEVGAMVAGVTG